MNRLQPFRIDQLNMDDYYFIAHLFDRVLIGDQRQSGKLIDALQADRVLELHLFDGKVEWYATRIHDQLMSYKPLSHHSDLPSVTRTYQLDNGFAEHSPYKKLIVKEYIDFDDNHLAYVSQSILYKLEE